MSFFQELFNPVLKCKRIGHQHRRRAYQVYLTPSKAKEVRAASYTYRAVAVEAEHVDDWCPRCGIIHSTSYFTITQLNGLTMHPHEWRRLREKGEVRA